MGNVKDGKSMYCIMQIILYKKVSLYRQRYKYYTSNKKMDWV